MPDISVTELQEWKDSKRDFCLLDIRQEYEIEKGDIVSDLHIPMQKLPEQLERLPKENPIVAICQHGIRSARAAEWLNSQGFDAYNLAGGVEAWKTLES